MRFSSAGGANSLSRRSFEEALLPAAQAQRNEDRAARRARAISQGYGSTRPSPRERAEEVHRKRCLFSSRRSADGLSLPGRRRTRALRRRRSRERANSSKPRSGPSIGSWISSTMIPPATTIAHQKRIPADWLSESGIDAFAFYGTYSHFRDYIVRGARGRYAFLTEPRIARGGRCFFRCIRVSTTRGLRRMVSRCRATTARRSTTISVLRATPAPTAYRHELERVAGDHRDRACGDVGRSVSLPAKTRRVHRASRDQFPTAAGTMTTQSPLPRRRSVLRDDPR